MRADAGAGADWLVLPVPSLARQPGRYLVAPKELVVVDALRLIKDIDPTGRGIDQFRGPFGAAGTSGADAVPFLELAGLVVDRHAVNKQWNPRSALGAAAPGTLFGWPDHPLVRLWWLRRRNRFRLLGALCTPTGEAVFPVRFQRAFLPAALAYAVFVLPHAAPAVCPIRSR